MAARRPTPAYNALNFSPDLGYGIATTPGSIGPDWYQQYLRSLGGSELPLGNMPPLPPPNMLFPPTAPEAPAPPGRSLLDDEDADIAGLAPRNALAAYGRRRF